MSSAMTQLEAAERAVLGKKVKARRRAGFVPANVIAKGKPSLAIEIPLQRLVRVLDQVGYTQALEIAVGDRKLTVLVAKITFPPAEDTPEHVVFLEVKKGERATAAVPLVLSGAPPGERKGLAVLQTLRHLEVTAPALRIPEQIEVDVSHLEEDGDTVRVEEIKLPAEVETEIDLQTPIVKLETPRAQVSQAEEQAEEDEAVDGEEADDDSAEEEPAEEDGDNQS